MQLCQIHPDLARWLDRGGGASYDPRQENMESFAKITNYAPQVFTVYYEMYADHKNVVRN
jgi:hypothetical protein